MFTTETNLNISCDIFASPNSYTLELAVKKWFLLEGRWDKLVDSSNM